MSVICSYDEFTLQDKFEMDFNFPALTFTVSLNTPISPSVASMGSYVHNFIRHLQIVIIRGRYSIGNGGGKTVIT